MKLQNVFSAPRIAKDRATGWSSTHDDGSQKPCGPTTPRTLTAEYENFLIVFCAVLSSLAGILVDLYVPSLQGIECEFHLSYAAVQNTIVFSIIGYAIDQLFFGVWSDWKGRRRNIPFGLPLLLLGSLCAASAHTISVLLLARALQGFAAGSAQVVARAVLIGSLKEHRLEYAFVYLSVAFAAGLIAVLTSVELFNNASAGDGSLVFESDYSVILLVVAFAVLRKSLPKVAQRTPHHSLSVCIPSVKRPGIPNGLTCAADIAR